MSRYYIKLNQETAQPLHSTWSRPNFFSKIIRGIPAFDNTRGGGATENNDNETPLEKAQSQNNVHAAAAQGSTSGDNADDSIIDEEDTFYSKSRSGGGGTPGTGKGNSPARSNPSPSSHAANGAPGSDKKPGSSKVRVDRSPSKKGSPAASNNFSHFPEDEHQYNYFDLEDDSDVDVVEEEEELVEVSTNMHEDPHEANMRHYFANQGASCGKSGGSSGSTSGNTSGSVSRKAHGNSMQNLTAQAGKAAPVPVDLGADAEIGEEIDEELS